MHEIGHLHFFFMIALFKHCGYKLFMIYFQPYNVHHLYQYTFLPPVSPVSLPPYSHTPPHPRLPLGQVLLLYLSLFLSLSFLICIIFFANLGLHYFSSRNIIHIHAIHSYHTFSLGPHLYCVGYHFFLMSLKYTPILRMALPQALTRVNCKECSYACQVSSEK